MGAMNDSADAFPAQRVTSRLWIPVRLLLVAVQLIFVYWFGQRGATFFYQGF